jgi:tRNA(Ile)-lysidine synthetase-like protein
LLEELLPGAAEALARTAEVSSEALAIVDDAVTRAKNDVQAGGVLSARRLRALPPPLRRAVLHRLLEDGVGMGVPRLLVLDVEALLSAPGSGRLDVGAGLMIVKEYDDVVFSGESFAAIRTAQLATGALPIAAGVPESVPAGASARGAVAVPDAASAVTDAASVPVATAVLPVPGFAMFLDLRVRAELVPGFAAHDPRAEAYLDADRIGSMLTVRGVCRGDRMRPLGTKGSRLLQDILVDRGVPAGRRSRVPVVHSGNTVVWLGGVAVSESSRITSGTRRYARLSIEGAAESDGQVGSSAGEQTHEGLDL